MLLAELVAKSRAVGEASARLQKVAHLSSLLERLSADEIEIAVTFLSGSTVQGRVGLGGAAIVEARRAEPGREPHLTLHQVDAAFKQMAGVSGAGSAAERASQLHRLMARATSEEQDFLARLLCGELRQGALEGVLAEAVAKAARIPAARIRRAAMLAGALAPAARAALAGGERALDALIIQPLRPVQPMLAASAADIGDALSDLGEASLEFKIDGARVQVHKAGDAVQVFTRNLRDVTTAVPEIVLAARALPAREIVLDGEAIALRLDGTPHPFQVTMRRFGRRRDVEASREALPISPFFFDVLYLDGAPLIDEPLSRRLTLLDGVVPAGLLVPRLTTASLAEASAFVERALAAGHEGVMAKAPGGVYAAGRRGSAWLKVKHAKTLDLVVLAAEWGSGRRRGTLSNLHLGARDDERGGFVMLGKTFKGLTDAMLEWQTRELLAREIARDGHTVYVRPELVAEIAFNDIQESPRYPGRLALRFARVKRYRTDKDAASADSYAAVQQAFRHLTGLAPPVR